MTDALLVALKAIYTANAPLVAALPNYRVAPAEERVPLKCLMVEIISAPGQSSYSASRDADIRVRFTVFAKGGTGGPLIDAVTAVYDVTTPAPTGLDCSSLHREGEPVPFATNQKDPDGDEVWGWSVDYIYSVHKS